VNGTHINMALFRIATECTQNAASRHCTAPQNLLAWAQPSSSTEVSVAEDTYKTVTTTVMTALTHTITYGDAALTQAVCPGSCDAPQTVEACSALAAPAEDCCNQVPSLRPRAR